MHFSFIIFLYFQILSARAVDEGVPLFDAAKIADVSVYQQQNFSCKELWGEPDFGSQSNEKRWGDLTRHSYFHIRIQKKVACQIPFPGKYILKKSWTALPFLSWRAGLPPESFQGCPSCGKRSSRSSKTCWLSATSSGKASADVESAMRSFLFSNMLAYTTGVIF